MLLLLSHLLLLALNLFHLRLSMLNRVIEDGAVLLVLRLRLVELVGLLLEAGAQILGITDLELSLVVGVAESLIFLATVDFEVVGRGLDVRLLNTIVTVDICTTRSSIRRHRDHWPVVVLLALIGIHDQFFSFRVAVLCAWRSEDIELTGVVWWFLISSRAPVVRARRRERLIIIIVRVLHDMVDVVDLIVILSRGHAVVSNIVVVLHVIGWVVLDNFLGVFRTINDELLLVGESGVGSVLKLP